MADRKLNEVPVVNDISHLLGVRSNGEIIRISKENMASVLGELIGIASKSNNGLMSRHQAIRSINKNNNIYCCLRLGIYEAGQV